MPYEISTPGKSTVMLFCERLAIEGGTVDNTTTPPVVTSSVVGITAGEDAIVLNDEILCEQGLHYPVGTVIIIPIEATSGIVATSGWLYVDWQSEDESIRDRGKVALLISDWRTAV